MMKQGNEIAGANSKNPSELNQTIKTQQIVKDKGNYNEKLV